MQFLFTLALLAILIWAAQLVLQSLPDLQRYVRIRNL